MSNRIVNAEVSGFNLDVYMVAAVYRADVRDGEENIIFTTTSGDLDGDDSVLAAVAKHFTGSLRESTLGKALVESARAEMKADRRDVRPSVPGWTLVEVIAERLKLLTGPEVHPDIRLDVAMSDDDRAKVAAAAALVVKLKFDVREK